MILRYENRGERFNNGPAVVCCRALRTVDRSSGRSREDTDAALSPFYRSQPAVQESRMLGDSAGNGVARVGV